MQESINKIIENKDVKKIYDIALKYYQGDEQTQINYNLAVELLKKAIELGENRAKFYLAESIYYGRGIEQSYEKAFKMFEEIIAETNNATAKFYIGEMYYYGDCVKVDHEKAYKIFNELVEQYNDIPAEDYLGRMYYYGKYVDQDYEKAYNIFSSLSEQHNYTHSRYLLGVMYYYGRYVDKDYQKAYEIFKGLIENTNKWEAKYYIGLMYYYGNYKEQDYEKAYNIFNELVEKYDDQYAKYYLGLMYLNGEYVDKDYEKAYEIFKYLVEKYDNDKDKKELAKVLYYMGKYKEALSEFQSLENQNDELGEIPYYIGEIHLKMGDEEKAFQYFKISELNNWPSAQMELVQMYLSEEREDIGKVLELCQSLIDSKVWFLSDWAKCVIGKLYYEGKEYGYDIEEDKEKGLKLIKEAAEANIPQALKLLEEIGKNK